VTKSKWQVTNEKSCEYELRCKRCKDVIEKRVMHTEGQWSDKTKCIQCLSCEKCSTVLEYKTNHVYDDTSNDELCKGIRKCIKCGEKTTVPPEHNFQLIRSKIDRGAHGSVVSHDYYKCTRCGFEKTEFDWSDDSTRDW
jgi:hypothetical protein